MDEKEATQTSISNTSEMNGSTDVNNTKTIYYGVYIPPDVQLQETDTVGSTVFVDKAESLKLVKKYKKARFKAFDFMNAAMEFSLNGSECPNNNSVDSIKNSQDNPAVGEKHSPFRGPTSQNLVKLRKGIETGDFDFVQQTIWDNPRYLIGSGDTPSILQEGFRYNALHVAAKAKKPIMCELILNTISNIKFIKKLYVDDKDPEERAKMLLDLYLNTPDKGLNETALHFAVKFGAPKCVEVLVSFPQCDKNLRNKHGKLPKEIICDRYDGPDAKLFSEQIAYLLNDNYYVPVLRSEDNCASPIIGEPFSPTSPPNFNTHPLSPRMEIHAYAGPMNKEGAVKFRRMWRTPPRALNFTTPLKSDVKLKDYEKGLERVGNNLAKKMKVAWKEYWPFLDSFIDLASEEGLRLFENYMADRTAARYNISTDLTQSPLNSLTPSHLLQEVELCSTNGSDNKGITKGKLAISPISELCQVFQACAIDDNSNKSPNTNQNHTNHSKVVHLNGNGDHEYEHEHDSLLNLTLNPLLCIDKSLQVFAKRISNDIMYMLEADYEKCTLIETQVKQLQLMMASYMCDNRFESVNVTLAHCRLASLIKTLFMKYLQDTNVQNVVNRIDLWLDVSSKQYDSISSDDEGGHTDLDSSSIIHTKNQHTICLLKTIRTFLNSNSVFKDVSSEDECVNVWKEMQPCVCSWDSKIVHGKKPNGKRLQSKRFTALVMHDLPRRLSFEENNSVTADVLMNGNIKPLANSEDEDGADEEFFTPPGTPSLLESYEDDDIDAIRDEEFYETQLPDVEIFIEGDIPTKVDYAAFNALKYTDCDLNPQDYPNVYRWHHAISLYNEKERVCWTTPNVIQYNLGSPSVTSTPVSNRMQTSVSPPLSSKDMLLSSPPYTPPKPWLRITGANSPRASLKYQKGNVSFNL